MDVIKNIVDTTKEYRIQETPYFKRLRLREESNLVHLREAKEILEKSAEGFLKLEIRKLRLDKLINRIRQNATEKKYRITPYSKPKPYQELVKERIHFAKQKGNEYSERNKISKRAMLCNYRLRNFLIQDKKSHQNNNFFKRKQYGEQVLKFNKGRFEVYKALNTPTCVVDKQKSENRKNEYGAYYELRNKLRIKHSYSIFDQEYANMLLQCIEFEKEHLDVYGYLEEKIKSNSVMGRKLLNMLASLNCLDCLNYSSDDNLSSVSETSESYRSQTSLSISHDSRNFNLDTSQLPEEIYNTRTKISSSVVDDDSDTDTDADDMCQSVQSLRDEIKEDYTNSNTNLHLSMSKEVINSTNGSNDSFEWPPPPEPLNHNEGEKAEQAEQCLGLMESFQEEEIKIQKYDSTTNANILSNNAKRPLYKDKENIETSLFENNFLAQPPAEEIAQPNYNYCKENNATASTAQSSTKPLEAQSIFKQTDQDEKIKNDEEEWSNLLAAFGENLLNSFVKGPVNVNKIKISAKAYILENQPSLRSHYQKF